MVPSDRLLSDLVGFWGHLLTRGWLSRTPPPRLQEKIFFLGFHKTGTGYYATLFRDNGYASLHSHTWRLGLPRVCDRFDVFLHGCLADFRQLDQQYPNSRMVVNTRALRGWLISRVHHMRKSYGHLRGPVRWMWNRGSQVAAGYGIESDASAVAAWIHERRRFHRDVLSYFRGKADRLLVLDIDDSRKVERLESFLRTRLPARPTERIHAGSPSPGAQRAVESLVDAVLRDLGVTDVHELI